jgi:hypothetical protein
MSTVPLPLLTWTKFGSENRNCEMQASAPAATNHLSSGDADDQQ